MPTSIIINFTHSVNGNDLVLYDGGCTVPGEQCLPDHSCCMGGLAYTNTAGEQYNVQRLNYIISNIKLHKNNETILLKEIHFIDASDNTTLRFDGGILENGDYTSISFTMGLENTMNINNIYINEGFHATMFWPEIMGGGYHYMKLEGDFDTITQGYATHTGALQMMGDPVRMDHSFNNNFDILLTTTNTTEHVNVTINMDINNWYANPNTINLESAIMGNMQKQMQLQANGSADVFSVEIVTRP